MTLAERRTKIRHWLADCERNPAWQALRGYHEQDTGILLALDRQVNIAKVALFVDDDGNSPLDNARVWSYMLTEMRVPPEVFFSRSRDHYNNWFRVFRGTPPLAQSNWYTVAIDSDRRVERKRVGTDLVDAAYYLLDEVKVFEAMSLAGGEILPVVP